MPGRNKALLPAFIPPQLTKSVEKAPAGAGWLHEIKFDGYRLHARIADKQGKLLTRTGLDWTAKYESVATALAKLPAKAAYIDGEVCAVRPDGSTSFAELQAATDHKESARLIYFAFDLLFLDGEDLSGLPLLDRKARLKSLLRQAPKNIQFVDHVNGQGQAFYHATCKHDAEGIVSKRVDAPYKPGDRGVWCKVKCINEDEFVVVGFTDPEGRRPYLGALLLGYYTRDRKLIYAGRAGTGMDEPELRRLYDKLKPLETEKMTVSEPPPRTNRFGSPLKLSAVHWVKPKLVAEVRYLTWTGDGLLRQVVYLGLRADKPAREVILDRAANARAET
jgi:bifunctional non-homologous end joining protein LigD